MADYPLVKFHFQVEWGGTRIGFAKASNLSVEVDVIEYREGSNKEHRSIKMPGLQRYGNIILERGMVKGDNEFFKWWNSIMLNQVERRDITISLLNESHEPSVVWKIEKAFPVKVVWGDLEASAREVAIETLEIACEGIKVINE
ncbi:MAG: phage tail protein [Cyclobacteriaceae bacterium]